MLTTLVRRIICHREGRHRSPLPLANTHPPLMQCLFCGHIGLYGKR